MKTFLFQGDSITDAGRDFQNDGNMGIGYALMTAGKIAVDYPGQFRTLNRGISGNRIVDVYARIKRDIINLRPDYMSILIGVNDVWHEIGSRDGVEPEKFRRIYEELILELKQALPELTIIILEPFVLCGPATEQDFDTFRTEVAIRGDICRDLAAKHGLLFVPLQRKLEELAEKTDVPYVLFDGVHPSPAGHELISRELYAACRTIL